MLCKHQVIGSIPIGSTNTKEVWQSGLMQRPRKSPGGPAAPWVRIPELPPFYGPALTGLCDHITWRGGRVVDCAVLERR